MPPIEPLTAIAFGAALLPLLILIVLAIRGREAHRVARSLLDTQSHLRGQLQQLSEQVAYDREALTQMLDNRLDNVGRRLGAGLDQVNARTSHSFNSLDRRLAVIDRAQQNMTALAGQVVDLQDILANKQSRGAFGEIQLNDLVRTILPPSAFQFQAGLSNGRRADCLIRMPHPPGPIAIDAKFPLESYRALTAAPDEQRKKQAERDFRAAIRNHVQDIRLRYIVEGETADSALMFLPSEAVYATLHADFPDLMQFSYRAKVWIVSPTTLMATLNTLRAVLKDVEMRTQAHVIQAEVGHLLADINRLDERVASLVRHFQQAEEDIRQIKTSSEKINRKIDHIEELPLQMATTAASQQTPEASDQ